MSEFSQAMLPPPPRAGNKPDADAVARLFDHKGDPADTQHGYELLETLGQGAMGEIILARQKQLNRLVALKMIRPELSGPGFRTRFMAEAEAVARLQHPNIVQIHEFGELDGRPFFALEYMEGGSLDQHLDGYPIPTNDAAKLVQTLALAVQHAHERGIIHRDLKPANVFLGKDQLPKVGDFGLSRAVMSGSPDSSSRDEIATAVPGSTRFGAVLGTPSYMSPEQAAGEVDRINATTDVYALGAILYECLTGRPPFRGATASETIGQVQQRDPVPVRQLRPGVPRDLETICLKCLQKEQSRRYGSATELADDLSRFQRGEPVTARPVGLTERLWKWTCRKPMVAALGMLASLSLVGMMVGGVVYQTLLRRTLIRSEKNYEQALSAVDRLLTRVGQDRLVNVPEMESVRADLLQDALEFYQGFMKGADDNDPTVRFETAQAHLRMARILSYLGRHSEAHAHCDSAIGLLALLTKHDLTQVEYRNILAESHLFSGSLGLKGIAPERSGEHFAVARESWKNLSTNDTPDGRFAARLAACDHEEALWHAQAGRLLQAEPLYLQAAASRRELVAKKRSDDVRAGLAMSLHNLAGLYYQTSRLADALAQEREAVREFESLASIKSRDDDAKARWASGLNSLATMQWSAGDRTAARHSHEKALQLREELAAAHPRVPAFRVLVAESCLNLAGMLNGVDSAKAEAAGRRGVEVMERLTVEGPAEYYRESLVSALQNLASVCQGQGRLDESATLNDRAIAILQQMVLASPRSVNANTLLSAACLNRGNVEQQRRRPMDALPWYQRAIDAAESALVVDPRLAQAGQWRLNAHGARAQTYDGMKEHARAVRDWDRVVELATEPLRTDYRVLRAESLARAVLCARAVSEARDVARLKAKEWNYLAHLARIVAIAAGNERDCHRADELLFESAAMLAQSIWSTSWRNRHELLVEIATHEDWHCPRQRVSAFLIAGLVEHLYKNPGGPSGRND